MFLYFDIILIFQESVDASDLMGVWECGYRSTKCNGGEEVWGSYMTYGGLKFLSIRLQTALFKTNSHKNILHSCPATQLIFSSAVSLCMVSK